MPDSFISYPKSTRHGLSPVSLRLLDRSPLGEALVPGPGGRVLLLPLLGEVLAHHVRGQQDEPVPGHEGQVGVGDLVADEVGLAGGLELAVEHADHAADLVAVAVQAGGQVLLRVVEGEPGALAVVGACG